jgi:hypothetical protein
MEMSRNKKNLVEEIVPEERTFRLAAEDVDETQQQIEEAAYYIGLNRVNNSHAGDHLNDWYEAEKAVKENLE